MNKPKKEKFGMGLIITGGIAVLAGVIVSMSTLFSLYGKVASDKSCVGKACEISSEPTMAQVGKYLMYSGLALTFTGIVFILLTKYRKNRLPNLN